MSAAVLLFMSMGRMVVYTTVYYCIYTVYYCIYTIQCLVAMLLEALTHTHWCSALKDSADLMLSPVALRAQLEQRQ
jgi:hypothetical protein